MTVNISFLFNFFGVNLFLKINPLYNIISNYNEVIFRKEFFFKYMMKNLFFVLLNPAITILFFCIWG